MLDKFTYKQRATGLAVLVVVFGYLIYVGAIKTTVELYEESNLLKLQVENANNAESLINTYNGKLVYLEGALGSNNVKAGTTFHERLLNVVANYCINNKIEVYQLPEADENASHGYNIETYEVVVRGDYKKLLKLLHHLEQVEQLRGISSVKFESKRNNKKQRTDLFAHIYFQNIKKHEES